MSFVFFLTLYRQRTLLGHNTTVIYSIQVQIFTHNSFLYIYINAEYSIYRGHIRVLWEDKPTLDNIKMRFHHHGNTTKGFPHLPSWATVGSSPYVKQPRMLSQAHATLIIPILACQGLFFQIFLVCFLFSEMFDL